MVRLIISNAYIDEYKYGLNLLREHSGVHSGEHSGEHPQSLDTQSYVIVPQHMTLQAELEILELLNVQGLFHPDVMNINRFIGKFSSDQTVIDDIGQILILLNIINQNKDRLKLYARSAKNLGFVENLGVLIHELRSNFIEPKQIELVMEELSQEHTLLKHKLSEIVLIYSEYCKYISAQDCDESGKIKAFIENIPKIRDWNKMTLCVEGFSDLNNSHLNLLAQLSHHVGQMQIRLVSAKENTPMFHHIERFKNRVIEVFHSHGADVEVVYAKGEANAFCKQMQGIFTGEREGAPITTVCSLNPREEIQNIVYRIVTDCKENGYQLSDFAVLSENISEYEHLIKESCTTFKIPYFVSNKNPLINNDYAEFILCSLQLILSRYQTKEVMRFLKNAFVDLEDRTIAKIKRYAIGHDLKYAHRWKKAMEDMAGELTCREGSSRFLACMDAIFQLEKDLNSSSNVADFIACLRDFLAFFDVQEVLLNQAKEAQEEGDLSHAQELAQIHPLIDNIFSQILMISEFELSIKNAYDLLYFAFCSIKIGVLPQNSESLFFGNIKLNKLSRLKKLYIINMSEGIIPARQDETGIFSFSERELLNQYRFLNMKDYSYEYNLATYNLYENMHAVVEEVTWSYPLFLQNEANLPSLWYAALLDEGEKPEFLQLSDEEIKKSAISHLYFDRLLSKTAGGEQMSEEEYGHLRYFLKDERCSRKFQAMLQGSEYSNTAVIDKNRLHSEDFYPEHLNVSISRLEKFAKCPYQHFVDYVLSPNQPPQPRFTSMDIGTLFHYMFERIMNHMSSLERDPARDLTNLDELSGVEDWDEKFETYYAILLQENPKSLLDARNVYFANRFKEILKNAVKYNMIQLQLTNFKNIYNELCAGKGPSHHVIDSLEIVHDEFKKISIIGKIDRVDLATLISNEEERHYFRVIDYKSGATQFSQKLFDAGLSLQLPIYLNMILNSREMKALGAKPYGAFYFVIPSELFLEKQTSAAVLSEFAMDGILLEDEKINRSLDRSIEVNGGKSLISPYEQDPNARSRASKLMMSDEKMSRLLEESVVKAAQLAQRIYEMEIQIAPVGNLLTYKPCEFCKYIDICKFDTSDDKQDYRYIR